MKETILTIAKWSEETFGDNITLEGQLDKFTEELKEFTETLLAPEETYAHQMEELSDLTIVASSIARFDITRSQACFGLINAIMDVFYITERELNDAVDTKMARNRTRKWGIGKGNFQHISEGDEE